jgi:hypothetical protein
MSIARQFQPAPESKKRSAQRLQTDQISRHLRNLYDNVLRQPVPGRFLELLRQLEDPSNKLSPAVESLDSEA